MSKQAVEKDGEILIVDTESGTYTRASESDPMHIPIVSDVVGGAGRAVGGVLNGILDAIIPNVK